MAHQRCFFLTTWLAKVVEEIFLSEALPKPRTIFRRALYSSWEATDAVGWAHLPEGTPGMESSHLYSPVSPQPIRFGLKDLFILLTVTGVLIAPAKWFGGIYLVSVGLSAGLVVACVLTYRKVHPAAALGVAFAGVVTGFPFVMVMAVFFVHSILNAILCVILLIFRPRAGVFAAALCLLAVGFYGYVLSGAAAKYQELAALRAEYPLVSLESRLAFEKSAHATNAAQIPPPQLTPAVAVALDEQDDSQQASYYRRDWALEELHERSYEHFARAAGFGFMRMPSLHKELVELPPRNEFELPLPLVTLSKTPTGMQLGRTHRSAIFDFVDGERMGYVRSRDAVAGFDSHGFSNLANRWTTNKKPARWQVTRLELVGLLRHDEPRVYVAASMPQMDQLADVPHRPLNDFEKAALPKLVSQQEVVVDHQPQRIQMLGAVRAGKTCLECHDGPRGKLLGAFSYEITPVVETLQASK